MKERWIILNEGFKDLRVYNLRGVAPDAMDIGAELGVLDTVYLHHIHRGVVHTIVFVREFIPCRL